MTDLDALLVLNHLRVGPITARRLLDYFGSPSAIFQSLAGEVKNLNFMSQDYLQRLLGWEKDVNLSRVWETLQREKIQIVTYLDDHYPTLLRQIYDHPLLFYMKGQLCPEDETALAIVGSRQATAYGCAVARRWAATLTTYGIPIISGLAAGVDTEAHWGALNAGGRTIALLGYGFGYIYPRSNEKLFYEIAERGAVITEYAYQRASGKGSFPLRNRLIAGMSRGTLVVESKARGGSLLTAHYANEYNRTVYAIPGNITAPLSEGTNNLIREGATLVTAPEQMLEEFQLMFQTPPQDFSLATRQGDIEKSLSGLEKQLYQLLTEPLTPDQLAQRSEVSIDKVSATLVAMEIKGLIIAQPGRVYERGEN